MKTSQIDDDAALARALQEAESTRNVSLSSTAASSSSSSSRPADNLDKYKNAKSISSANYFGSEDNEEERSQRGERMQQFSGANSISSDAYYGRRRTSSTEGKDDPSDFQMMIS